MLFLFNPSIASKFFLYHQRLLSHHLDSNPPRKTIHNRRTKKGQQNQKRKDIEILLKIISSKGVLIPRLHDQEDLVLTFLS